MNNDGDGSDGYDGFRGSDINDNSLIVMTGMNQEKIISNTIEKGQGLSQKPSTSILGDIGNMMGLPDETEKNNSASAKFTFDQLQIPN